MFAVIYQSYLKPGRAEDFQQAWHQIASYFVAKRGALGSCLHKAEDGKWIAYSRWPDKATRDASWPVDGPEDNAPSNELPEEIRQAILIVKDCVDQDRKLPDICMDVVTDLLR
jgi:hypothetical protein